MPDRRTVGVSLFSLFPTFFVPGGYQEIAKLLDLGDYTLGVELLPFRGMNANHVRLFTVLSYEGPWNCSGPFSQFGHMLMRPLGVGSKDYPSVLDVSLFGSEPSCRDRIKMIQSIAPTALAIDLPGWVNSSAIEPSPDMYNGKARQWQSSTPNGVVIDTYHWRCLDKGWRECHLIEYGGSDAVRMVHIKLLSPGEIVSFLRDDADINAEVAAEFLANDTEKKIPVILEVEPRAMLAYTSKIADTSTTLRALTERVWKLF